MAQLATFFAKVNCGRYRLDNLSSYPFTSFQLLHDLQDLLNTKPHETILCKDGSVYLKRWKLLNQKVWFEELLGKNENYNHDYSWNHTSIILEGRQIEEFKEFKQRPIVHIAGAVIHRPYHIIHHISVHGKRALSLTFPQARIQDWGFYFDGDEKVEGNKFLIQNNLYKLNNPVFDGG